MRKRTNGQRAFAVFNTLFMSLFAIICLYPMLHVICGSFSEPHLLASNDGLLLKPAGFSLEAYEAIFSNNVIVNGYANTLFVLIVGTSINMILTIVAAYVLSSKDVFWKFPIMMMIVITMYFQGGMIPDYLNIRRLGLYNSIWSVILPVAVNSFNLIIMRTGFESIPNSLLESADLDGANDFHKLLNIVVPLAKPTIAVIILYYGVAHWNSWFTASIYISDKGKMPLQVILREILILNSTDSMSRSDSSYNIGETIKYSTIVVSTLPILCIYPFLQKYFANGVMVGAVKG
ncbi:MAG: carbohydrate ABC transporter permease [Clostridia bacterium]|nr:carbohydrate ABC transporter permease [Clostridia bacterium]